MGSTKATGEKMYRNTVESIDSCNRFLESNTCFSNGKNFTVDRLYESAARSRLPHENLLGIYLAKPEYTWMALWLAITSRAHLRKRQISYFRPDNPNGDHIGRVGLHNPKRLSSEALFCQQGHLFLFEPGRIRGLPRLDLSGITAAHDKEVALLRNGFRMETTVHQGTIESRYAPSFTDGLLVDIDEWQVAVVNTEHIIPDAEIVIEEDTIRRLSDRVSWLQSDTCKDYIQPVQRAIANQDGVNRPVD